MGAYSQPAKQPRHRRDEPEQHGPPGTAPKASLLTMRPLAPARARKFALTHFYDIFLFICGRG